MHTSFINQNRLRYLIPKEEAIRLLKDRHVKGLSLNQNQVKKENARLYHSVVRYWGKWSHGLKTAGVPGRKYRFWTKEMVMAAVKQRYQEGLSLKHQAILEDDPSLIVQIRKFYGTKHNILQFCGILPREITKDSLLEILKNQSRKRGGLNSRELRGIKVYGLMLKYFGTKANAYKAIGLNDIEIRKLKHHLSKWSEETVIKVIQDLKEKGNRLSGGIINKTNPSLYRAARTHFGSWAGALQSAGIPYQIPKVCRKTSKWNREKILEKLKDLLIIYGDNKSIPLEERFKYYWLCRRYFGSTNEAWKALAGMARNENQ